MKIKLSTLKKLIKERVIEEEIRLSQDSIDDQIDGILLRFEEDCVIEDDSEMGFEEGLVSLQGTLFEAPEDEEEEDPAAEEEPADDPGAEPADPIGGEEEPAEEEDPDLTADKDDQEPDVPSEPMAPQIDVSKFAGKVSRLAINHVNLLDPETVIVNRAYNYLESNYDQSVADEFAEIMERDFQIEINRPSGAEPEELPMAIGAAASGLG